MRMGSDGSAAKCGRSDLSEWPRSVCNTAAPSARRTPGTATGELRIRKLPFLCWIEIHSVSRAMQYCRSTDHCRKNESARLVGYRGGGFDCGSNQLKPSPGLFFGNFLAGARKLPRREGHTGNDNCRSSSLKVPCITRTLTERPYRGRVFNLYRLPKNAAAICTE